MKSADMLLDGEGVGGRRKGLPVGVRFSNRCLDTRSGRGRWLSRVAGWKTPWTMGWRGWAWRLLLHGRHLLLLEPRWREHCAKPWSRQESSTVGVVDGQQGMHTHMPARPQVCGSRDKELRSSRSVTAARETQPRPPFAQGLDAGICCWHRRTGRSCHHKYNQPTNPFIRPRHACAAPRGMR